MTSRKIALTQKAVGDEEGSVDIDLIPDGKSILLDNVVKKSVNYKKRRKEK